MKAIVPFFVIALLASPALTAQEVVPAEVLADGWKRKKTVVETEIRRTKGMKGAAVEFVEATVDTASRRQFSNIQFTLNQAKLDGAVTFQQLAEIAKAMKSAGGEKFLIEGHTCDLGGEGLNKDLSVRRAEAVIAELTRLGVAPNQLRPMGFGAEQPLVDNTSEEARSKNRRVQIFRAL